VTREFPARPIVGVGAVVVQDGRVLLVKRRSEPLAGQWSLPGGAVEVGETLAAALAREVFEETGLTISVGPLVAVLDRILLDADDRVQYHYVLIDYLCRVTGGELCARSDAADALFVDPADIDRRDLTERTAGVIRRALEMGGPS
jgi:ADP-ribose pyrophosphatase YjhB (NUDIX family)